VHALQDLEERHQREITILKQRVKHLLYEHQTESSDSKTEGLVSLKMSQDVHRESEEELKRDRRALTAQLREMEAAHEAYLRELRREHDKSMTGA
jgi:growth arrest-specific protein 8